MKYLVLVCCLLPAMGMTSCKKEYEPVLSLGYWHWIDNAPYPGLDRSNAVVFSIGTKAYVGLGYNGVIYKNDFHVFDATKGYWTSPVSDFPGFPREGAIAFSLKGKGYLGTGYNRDSVAFLKDFWEYDPAIDHWTQLHDFPSFSRANAIAFTDESYGYVGLGFDSTFFGDFWRYDPAQDSWTEVPGFTGAAREQSLAMTIDNQTYIFSGSAHGSPTFDLWKFDPSRLSEGNNPWSNITPASTGPGYGDFKLAVNRNDAVAFVLNNKGYVTTGSNGSYLNSTYEFDPSRNTWRQMASLQRFPRSQAVAFALGDSQNPTRAFITTGLNANLRLYDLCEFSFSP